MVEMAAHDPVVLIAHMAQQGDGGEQQGEVGAPQPGGGLPGKPLGVVDVGRHVGGREGE